MECRFEEKPPECSCSGPATIYLLAAEIFNTISPSMNPGSKDHLKVLIVNTYDRGGAAKACIRLHLGLLGEGVDSKLLVKQKADYSLPRSFFFPQPAKGIPSIEEILVNKTKSLLKKTSLLPETAEEKENKSQLEFLAKRPAGLDPFSFPFAKTDITLSPLYLEADIVHLHWVGGFLDYPTFFQKNTKPLVWTLHDTGPFLDGEHYAEKYLGMDEAGHPIPRVYSQEEKSAGEKYLAIKSKALERVKSLAVVAPSPWLKKESEHSPLFKRFPHYHIPYGCPTDIFKPLDKAFCREVLGIPKDMKVLLFVANDIKALRKGYIYLQQAFGRINKELAKDLFLCAVGRESGLEANENLLELGEIHDERLMAMAYSAADVFVLPSLEDNLPNTMVESLLCGTPVIGFPVGGIADTIENGINGFLCEGISVESLKTTIEKYFSSQHTFDAAAIAKASAPMYNLTRQAKQYIELYQKLLAEA